MNFVLFLHERDCLDRTVNRFLSQLDRCAAQPVTFRGFLWLKDVELNLFTRRFFHAIEHSSVAVLCVSIRTQ